MKKTLLALILALFAPQAIAQETVVLRVALLVDESTSMHRTFYRLQRTALADALRQECVINRIERTTPETRIEFAVVEWSSADKQRMSIPWTAPTSATDVEHLATQVETFEEEKPPSGYSQGRTQRDNVITDKTAPGEAVLNAMFYAGRPEDSSIPLVVDLVVNGRPNQWLLTLPEVRDAALQHNTTINIITTPSEPDRNGLVTSATVLAGYYSENLATGFVIPVEAGDNWDTRFMKAMADKLCRELTS